MAEETYGDSAWWIAVCGSQAVAYAGLYTAIVGEAWLVRAGVLQAYRGGGLQQRLIRVRLREAARRGIPRVLTYTSAENIPSQRNLVSCGFKPYFSNDGVIYFGRTLQVSGQSA